MLSATKLKMLSKKSATDTQKTYSKQLGGAFITVNHTWITNGYWAFLLKGDYRSYKDITNVPEPLEYPRQGLELVWENFQTNLATPVKLRELDLSKSTVQVKNFYFNSKYVKLALDIVGKTSKALCDERENASYIKVIGKDVEMIFLSLRKGSKEL